MFFKTQTLRLVVVFKEKYEHSMGPFSINLASEEGLNLHSGRSIKTLLGSPVEKTDHSAAIYWQLCLNN